jgi:UDP-MurNAc hydroxylase
MPFAGTYIIGGSEYKKNKKLPQPEIQDAVNFLQAKLYEENIDLKPVLLNYNEHFSLETKRQSAEYIPVDPQERDKYISKEASKFIYDFEKDTPPDSEELMSLFESSLVRFKRKQTELNFYEDMYLLFDLPCKNFASVNLLDSSLSTTEDLKGKSKYHRFQLDPRLLKRVLMGPRFANWNNIEIGALLNFSRKPDVYRMDVHTLINALHV